MNTQITDYRILEAHDPRSLESEVNPLLAVGWQPLGGVKVVAPVLNDDAVAPIYIQTMIKTG